MAVLQHILTLQSREDAKIPKRGEKDFEPHATTLQSNTLSASRAAMHDALSFQRVHVPKKEITTIYHPETNMAYADAPRSTLFRSMGRVLSPKDDPLRDTHPNQNRLWLLPEEILYLIERGTVDARWPTDDKDVLGLPMSLQGAYAAFIGLSDEHDDGLTSARYSVYSALKRLGYAVHRAPTWSSAHQPPQPESFAPLPGTWRQVGISLDRWRHWAQSELQANQKDGPMLQKNFYRGYRESDATVYQEQITDCCS